MKFLDIKIRSTHGNYVNGNLVLYRADAIKDAVDTWNKPYAKPQLVYHDKESDAVGRITAAKFINNSIDGEPANYIELTARISDPAAIEKILDGRYYSVSVGSRSKKTSCSVCGQVFNEDGLCEHQKGDIDEDGNVIYWIVDEIEYTECSFVNNPADVYARIDSIYINDMWFSYEDAMTLIEKNIVNMEDTMRKTSRDSIQKTAFCGPNQTFPAQDKEHVLSGLALMDTITVSDKAKAKIKASLYRKGKRFGIVPQKDDVGLDLTFRMNDEFSEEETKEIDTWFKDHADSDLPSEVGAEEPTKSDGNQATTSMTTTTSEDKIKEVEDKLSETNKKLEDALKEIENKDKEIAELKLQLETKDAILIEKENEINKLLDENALLVKDKKDALIDNIIDLNTLEDSKKDEFRTKLSKRTVESLTDNLLDLRTLCTKVILDTRIEDPTKTSDTSKVQKNKDLSLVDIFTREIDPLEG